MVLGLVGLAVLIGLGSWQMNRLAWKDALLASIEQRTHAAPRPIAEIERQFGRDGDVEYWPVEATGAFLHDKERHFFATFDGQSGFFVYTPLELADGRVVFVNRGFVPYDRKDAATRAQGQVAGPVTISGLARNPLAGKPSSIVPDNEPDKNIFYWKDLAVDGEIGRRRSVEDCCRSSSTRGRRPIPAVCRSAASPSSTCPTITCNMPSPGMGLPRHSPACSASGCGAGATKRGLDRAGSGPSFRRHDQHSRKRCSSRSTNPR